MTNQQEIIPVLLAGGSGTRLWPLSKATFPKPFLKLMGDYSSFQLTLLELRKMKHVSQIVVVINQLHDPICQRQIEEIDVDSIRIITEPYSRNTAPAIALAAKYIKEKIGIETLMFVSPSDHLLKESKELEKSLDLAIPAAKEGFLVTFGVPPTAPKTEYGYIYAGKKMDNHAFVVNQFIEKPTIEKAKQLLQSSGCYWNSGMFLARAQTYLEELKKTAYPTYQAISKACHITKEGSFRIERESFKTCPAHSIDYAVMEKTSKAAVIPSNLFWVDLGNWDSIARMRKVDKKGNFITGNVIETDCEGCFLHSDGPTLVTIGLKNKIIVSTSGEVLIVDKPHTDKIKKVVQELSSLSK